MYFPFMRGKQFELLALKEVASRLDRNKIRPIIEPINDNIVKLGKTIESLNNVGITPHIIVNPEVGDLASDTPDHLYTLLVQESVRFTPCIRLYNQNINHTKVLINKLIKEEINYSLYLQEEILSNINNYISSAIANIIVDKSNYPQLYLNSIPRCVIIDSSFPSEGRNADYSSNPQFFSDAHLTYTIPLVQQQIGFGDYLIINNKWNTGGGPAFVIAIHITYIEKSNSNMYVKHSLSVTNPTDQSNPAGKFQEALQAMMQFANQNPSLDQNTLGFQEYINLFNSKHYPGLGVPKKLSMMHHLETMNNYL